MTDQARRNPPSFFQRTGRWLRRLAGFRACSETIGAEAADSYVGLFQGVIENDAPAATPAPRPRPAPARTSGFVRLEVDQQKKATGCFLFFVDGKVLTGAIEGSSERTGVVEASFRLNNDGGANSQANAPRPVAAVGRLTLEARCPRRPVGPAEDMTIRFV